jgi:hypothetical protein
MPAAFARRQSRVARRAGTSVGIENPPLTNEASPHWSARLEPVAPIVVARISLVIRRARGAGSAVRV